MNSVTEQAPVFGGLVWFRMVFVQVLPQPTLSAIVLGAIGTLNTGLGALACRHGFKNQIRHFGGSATSKKNCFNFTPNQGRRLVNFFLVSIYAPFLVILLISEFSYGR